MGVNKDRFYHEGHEGHEEEGKSLTAQTQRRNFTTKDTERPEQRIEIRDSRFDKEGTE